MTIEIHGLSVMIEGGLASARYIQRFSRGSFADTGEKLLKLRKTDGMWRIISEEWKPLDRPVHLPDSRPVVLTALPGDTDAPAHREEPETLKDETAALTPPVEPGSETPSDTPQPSSPVSTPVSNAGELPSPPSGTEPAAGVFDLPPPPLSVKESGIRYRVGNGGGDQVCVRLDRFFVPKVFALEGDRPRIVIDIPDVQQWDGLPAFFVQGERVRRIRSYLHLDEHRLRIVLDLQPAESYAIDQVFNHEEKTFCLIVQ